AWTALNDLRWSLSKERRNASCNSDINTISARDARFQAIERNLLPLFPLLYAVLDHLQSAQPPHLPDPLLAYCQKVFGKPLSLPSSTEEALIALFSKLNRMGNGLSSPAQTSIPAVLKQWLIEDYN